MYYPIQVPYLLDTAFSRHAVYTEEAAGPLQSFVICTWEMLPRSGDANNINNIVVADGCIDLVVNFNSRSIAFAGMSKTDFNFTLQMPRSFIGARMKPGAFHQLTGLPASAAMDSFLPLDVFDPSFVMDAFFALSYEQAKESFRGYLSQLVGKKEPDDFVKMFDTFSITPPSSAAELYRALHLSPRQCQRLFMKHFGITPQAVLSILRFQCCLQILTSTDADPNHALEAAAYYDQSHFIKDFKKNIGLTPREYLQKCKI